MHRFQNTIGRFEVTVFRNTQEQLAAKKPRFSVDFERVGSATVLRCAGRLCFDGEVKLLAESAERFLRRGDDLVLDLADVQILDSAGIGQLVLISMQAQALRREVCIAAAPERVRLLLELTNVASLFEFFPSVELALTSLAEQVA
jgi:anti-sigma B factor antagonist